MGETVEAMIEGGKASPAPPLGPALGPSGVNVQEVISALNEKTKGFKGMQVPIKVIVNDDKSFDIEVGSPPTSSLIKKEMGVKNLKVVKEGQVTEAGDIGFDKIVEIAKSKEGNIMANSLEASVKQVLGTCLSGGVTVDGKDPREIQKEITEGTRKVE